MTRVVVGFDLATVSGWAIWKKPSPARWKVGTIDTCKKDTEGERWATFRGKASLLLTTWNDDPPALVVFEDVRGHRGTYAAQLYGGYRAHLLELCHAGGLAVVGVKPSQLKRWATGKGNADKPAMVERARAQLLEDGIDPPAKLTHDEADAILLVAWALSGYHLQ